jgi:hypothetical protein
LAVAPFPAAMVAPALRSPCAEQRGGDRAHVDPEEVGQLLVCRRAGSEKGNRGTAHIFAAPLRPAAHLKNAKNFSIFVTYVTKAAPNL